MSDARLRSLERRWEESGEVEHGVRYLQESLRAGVLEPERVRFAAYLGEPAARALSQLEGDLRRTPDLPDAATAAELLAWGAPLAGWGDNVARRCGLAIVRPLFPQWDHHSERLTPRWRRAGKGDRGRPRLDPRPAELLAALEAWAHVPTPTTLLALDAAWAACEEVTFLRAETPRGRAALDTVRALLCASRADPVGVLRVAYDHLHPLPGARVRAALHAEVLPWALARGAGFAQGS